MVFDQFNSVLHGDIEAIAKEELQRESNNIFIGQYGDTLAYPNSKGDGILAR